MFPLIKLLKVVLPVVTATTATIVTASLVSFKKEDLDKNKDKQDRLLDNFEIKVAEFKEKIILYSEDGVENAITLEDESLKEKVLEKLKNGEELNEPNLGENTPNLEQVKEFLSKAKERALEAMKRSKGASEAEEVKIQLPEHSDFETPSGMPDGETESKEEISATDSRETTEESISRSDSVQHQKENTEKGLPKQEEAKLSRGTETEAVSAHEEEQEEEEVVQEQMNDGREQQKQSLEETGAKAELEPDQHKDGSESKTSKPTEQEDGLDVESSSVSDVSESSGGSKEMTLEQLKKFEALREEMSDSLSALEKMFN